VLLRLKRLVDWQAIILRGIKRVFGKLPIELPIKAKLHHLILKKYREEYKRNVQQLPLGKEIPSEIA